MIAATGLRWVLTVLFAVPALSALWRAATPGRADGGPGASGRVAHLLHAVMALAMVAMVWPWGMDVPARPQIILFTLAAGWYAGVALARPAPLSRARALSDALPHTVMMGAMAWMAAAMVSSASMPGHGGSHDMADMPGMDMSAGSGTATMTLTGTGPRLAAGLLAGVLLVLALWWLARGFDAAQRAVATGPRHPSPPAGRDAFDLGCHGAMALGMAVTFVLLL
ncbi:DUF5134 domain-containing protein [Streptomyces rapamycinicus]|uniref:DUF5134 domain-containing protein n=2 Tax=Streptomyces rapamycinicus TaxID=1226757 RepID=A0A0A0N925_STRRN|nr:DUF5134 domain-containing protein [Streptomyces rapamycinicus]AGP53294.1 hypothetical protein M271_08370 [Streptomyces rapamycinicus NRRL 5491]MBB4780779.1 hypothetical protein [Streptomyces rapamycinicus]RLV74572.1 hypothetical protein D3C57_135140 [Streptomyces rapamycinicus NRRL 5491]UTO61471.1 DUF5134 domain-containing protein [Streptomyces rapamycinicus]UTP29418.1 DUF5134 domain-containing protein [Streptomyces rapamycinicus NRRL 5491]